jgi:hypothetical protein
VARQPFQPTGALARSDNVAVTRQPTARKVGELFAEQVRCEPIVKGLWVTEENQGIHLWLLIDRIEDDDSERALYSLVGVLDDPFPESDIQLHVMNPRDYQSDPRRSLPTWAEQIPLTLN